MKKVFTTIKEGLKKAYEFLQMLGAGASYAINH